MKRLALFIITVFSLSFLAMASTAAALVPAARYWEVKMYDPSASTVDRTLNVEFKVQSTNADDHDYTVKLFQNETEVAQQIVSQPEKAGDSGVFSVAIPATGTYTYKVSATNVNAGETKTTPSHTVEVVNGPEPTVTTVFVTPATSTAGTTSGAATGTTAGAGTTGAVAGATTTTPQTGTTTPTGAAQTGTNNNGDILGASTEKDAAKKRNYVWPVLVGLAGLAAIAYAFNIVRKRRADY